MKKYKLFDFHSKSLVHSPPSSLETAVLLTSILGTSTEERMDSREISEVKAPVAHPSLIAPAAPTNAPARAIAPESRILFTKNFMRYPPRHNNVAPLKDSHLAPLNKIHQLPNLGSRMDNLDFIAGSQTPVRNRMDGITERGKENTIPTSISPFWDPEIKNKSPKPNLINPQQIYENPEFIAAQSMKKRYEKSLQMSKAQEILWIDGEHSHHTKKDAQASLPWSNTLHKDKTPGVTRRPMLSSRIKLSPRKRQRFDLHRKVEGKDKLKTGSSVDILKSFTGPATEDKSSKFTQATINEFSFDESKSSLSINAKNNIQAQAPTVSQPKTPQREPQAVFQRSIENLKYFCGEGEKGNHFRSQHLLTKMPPPVQITTNFQRQLIQNPSLVGPTIGKANLKQQSYSAVEVCSRLLSSNHVIPVPQNLYKPIHSPGIGRMSQQQNLSSVPELYLRIPNSAIFVPTPRIKPRDSKGQFKSSLALYAIPSQILLFDKEPKLTFTAYVEVTRPNFEAVMSSSGRFFQVAGYLVLKFPSSTPLPEKRQFPKPAPLDDGLDYDLLSIRPRIGEMKVPIVHGPDPQIPSRQPNPLLSANQQKNGLLSWDIKGNFHDSFEAQSNTMVPALPRSTGWVNENGLSS